MSFGTRIYLVLAIPLLFGSASALAQTASVSTINPPPQVTVVIAATASQQVGDGLEAPLAVKIGGTTYNLACAPEHDVSATLNDVGALYTYTSGLSSPVTVVGGSTDERLGYRVAGYPSSTPNALPTGVVVTQFGLSQVKVCPLSAPLSNLSQCASTISPSSTRGRFGSALDTTLTPSGKKLLAIGSPGTVFPSVIDPYVDIYDITNASSPTLLFSLKGQLATEFGSAVHFMEDVNGDGFEELAIGIPAGGSNTVGQTVVYSRMDIARNGTLTIAANGTCSCSGACSPGCPTQVGQTILGDEAASSLGSRLASNSSFGDLLVSAPLDNDGFPGNTIMPDRGRVAVFRYASNSWNNIRNLAEAGSNENFGNALESMDLATSGGPSGARLAGFLTSSFGLYGNASVWKYDETNPVSNPLPYYMLGFHSAAPQTNVPMGAGIGRLFESSGWTYFGLGASGLSNPMTSRIDVLKYNPVHHSINPGNAQWTVRGGCDVYNNAPGQFGTLGVTTTQVNTTIPSAVIQGDASTDAGGRVLMWFGTLNGTGQTVIAGSSCLNYVTQNFIYGTDPAAPIILDQNAQATVQLMGTSIPAGWTGWNLGAVFAVQLPDPSNPGQWLNQWKLSDVLAIIPGA